MDRGTLATQLAKFALTQAAGTSPTVAVGRRPEEGTANAIVATTDAMLLGASCDRRQLQSLYQRRRMSAQLPGDRSPWPMSRDATTTSSSTASPDSNWRAGCHFLTLVQRIEPDHTAHCDVTPASRRAVFAHAATALSHITRRASSGHGQWGEALAGAAVLMSMHTRFLGYDCISASTMQRTYSSLVEQSAMSVGGDWREVLAQVRSPVVGASSTPCITSSNFKSQLCLLRNGHGARWREALAFGLVTALHPPKSTRSGDLSDSISRPRASTGAFARSWVDDADDVDMRRRVGWMGNPPKQLQQPCDYPPASRHAQLHAAPCQRDDDKIVALRNLIAQWMSAAERLCGRIHARRSRRENHEADALSLLGQLNDLLPKLDAIPDTAVQRELVASLFAARQCLGEDQTATKRVPAGLLDLLHCVSSMSTKPVSCCDLSRDTSMEHPVALLHAVLLWFGTRHFSSAGAPLSMSAVFVEAMHDHPSLEGIVHTTFACWLASLKAPGVHDGARVSLMMWCVHLVVFPATGGDKNMACDARRTALRRQLFGALLSLPSGVPRQTTAEKRLLLDLLLQDWCINRALYCNHAGDRHEHDLTTSLAMCVQKVGDPTTGCRRSSKWTMQWIEVLGACRIPWGGHQGAEGGGDSWMDCCCVVLSSMVSWHPWCLGDARVARLVGRIGQQLRVEPASSRQRASLTLMIEHYASHPPVGRDAPHVADALLGVMDALSPIAAGPSFAVVPPVFAPSAWGCGMQLLACAVPALTGAPTEGAARLSFVLALLLHAPLPAQERKALSDDMVSWFTPQCNAGVVEALGGPTGAQPPNTTVALLQHVIALHHNDVQSCVAATQRVPGDGRTKRCVCLQPPQLQALLRSCGSLLVAPCPSQGATALDASPSEFALHFLRAVHGHLLRAQHSCTVGTGGLPWCDLIVCARLYEERAVMAPGQGQYAGDTRLLKEHGATRNAFVWAAIAGRNSGRR